MGLPTRMLPCVQATPFFRLFHASSPLFEEETKTEAKPTDIPAGENAATEEKTVDQTIEEQLADIKKQLDASSKEVGFEVASDG